MHETLEKGDEVLTTSKMGVVEVNLFFCRGVRIEVTVADKEETRKSQNGQARV